MLTATVPAPPWRRYTAWSLDFALLGALATWLAWPHLLSGGRAAARALRALSAQLAQTLGDGLLQGAAPDLLARQLLADPRVLSAAAAVQAGLGRAVLWWLFAYAALAAPYHIGFERSAWRGSPGKHALQLRVVTRDGTRAWLPRIVLRHFSGALSWLTLNLGHALATLPPDRRALHDRIAGLQVESRTTAPLPGWARAWLAVQVAAGVAFAGWGLQRYIAALRAGLG